MGRAGKAWASRSERVAARAPIANVARRALRREKVIILFHPSHQGRHHRRYFAVMDDPGTRIKSETSLLRVHLLVPGEKTTLQTSPRGACLRAERIIGPHFHRSLFAGDIRETGAGKSPQTPPPKKRVSLSGRQKQGTFFVKRTIGRRKVG
jgi:hypothetical protein